MVSILENTVACVTDTSLARLAADRADKKIERKLKLEPCQAVEKRTAWLCTVATSDIQFAGTDAHVYIQVRLSLFSTPSTIDTC